MRPHAAATVVAGALAFTSGALAGPKEHFDVWIRSGEGRIVTGSITERGVPADEVFRVFGGELADLGGGVIAASDPGYQALDGTFGPLQELQINITDAVTLWNGNGFGPTGQSMTLAFGPQSVTSGPGFVEGFSFAMDAEGGFHGHFDIMLNGEGGPPGTGIYLLPLSLSFRALAASSLPGQSDTFWFVMNWGLAEAEHDAAIDWVHENLVPAPGTLCLAAAVPWLRRRRRRRSPIG